MPVKLSDVKGLMIKSKIPHDPRLCLPSDDMAWNRAIHEQSQRVIGLNRDKLAKKIFLMGRYTDDWEPKYHSALIEEDKISAYAQADEIIAAEHELLEVKQ